MADEPDTSDNTAADGAAGKGVKRRSPLMIILLVLLGVVLTAFLAALAGYSISKMIKTYMPVQLHVSDKADSRDVGLPVYPGAKALPEKDTDGDNNSAHILALAGDVGLKVAAVSYQSGDAPDKILAFYRTALAQYGKVTECAGDMNVGWDDDKDPGDKDDDTAAEDRKENPRAGTHLDIHIQDDHSNIRVRSDDHKGIVVTGDKGMRCSGDAQDGQVLKAGTDRDFHMVKVQPDGSGSHFAMVYVRLKGLDK